MIDVPYPEGIVKRLRVKDVWPSTPCIASARCPDCEKAVTTSPPYHIQCPRRILYRRVCNGILKHLVTAARIIVVHIQYSKTYQIWCTSPVGQPEGSRWCHCKIWQACHSEQDDSSSTENRGQPCICLSCLELMVERVDDITRDMDRVKNVWSGTEPLRADRHKYDDTISLEISASIGSGTELDFWASVYTEDGSVDVSARTDEQDITYCSSNVLSEAASCLADFQTERQPETRVRVALALSGYVEHVYSGYERESGEAIQMSKGRDPVERSSRRKPVSGLGGRVRTRAKSLLRRSETVDGKEQSERQSERSSERPSSSSLLSPFPSSASGSRTRSASFT